VAANAGGTTFGSIRALTLAWRIALTSRTLPVGRNHKAFVHLRCASGGATCAGVLTLQTPGAPRARPLAKQTFSVRAGRAGTVILGLSPNATRRLAHQPLLSASLSISGRGLTGTSRVTVVLRSNTISRRR